MSSVAHAPIANERLFYEEQRFRGSLVWSIIAGGAVASLLPVALPFYEDIVRDGAPWTAFWTDERVGAAVGSALGLAIMGGLAALFARAKLTVAVFPETLAIRFRGLFVDRTISLADIAHAEAVTYRPVAAYGGWGLRRGPEGKAYNVSGNRGVRLTFADGRTLLLGSRRADALAAAIARARGTGA